MDDVKKVLRENNFHFQKRFGQNFVTDNGLLCRIAQAGNIGSDDVVIEIGAGAGTLTAELARRAKKVVAYEIDVNLKPVLGEVAEEYPNIEFRFSDFMKTDLSEIFEENAGDTVKVVANLPYYITTPALMRVIESGLPFASVTVMVQKEVALRLTAKAGSSDYGAITVAVEYGGDATYVETVPREMFMPMPNVDSAVVNLTCRKKYFPKSEEMFKRTLKAAFAMRRKTLANNLKKEFSFSADVTARLLEKCGFALTARGEELTCAEIVLLSDEILSLKS